MENLIALKDLRLNMERYVQKVKMGQSFVVLKQSKPIFRVAPVEADEKWEEVKQKVWERDRGKCRLISILSKEEYQQLLDLSNGFLLDILDLAHILPRSGYPQLIYNADNCVLLNRWSHSFLDNYKDPITGENTTKEQHLDWWYRVVGGDYYNNLLIESKKI